MNISVLWHIVRHMGMRWVIFRALYVLKLRLGYFERSLPGMTWDKVVDNEEDGKIFGFIPDIRDRKLQLQLLHIDSLETGNSPNVIEEAEAVLCGEYILFGFHRKHIGFPPEWHKNPFTGEIAPRGVHWSRIPDFKFGDIKAVWELSRFPWAFALARAYARTQNDRYAEGFWKLFENWLEENPPNTGVNWKCGQEAAFRLMAAAFARRVFSSSNTTTQERLSKWRKFVGETGTRIAGNLSYALSQKNNHGISECVGLLLAARILPNSPDAQIWGKRALSALRRQVNNLVYEDGSFSQHSTVYHRLLLHDLAWYAAMEQTSICEQDDSIIYAGRRAGAFLQEITDLTTGEAPLCGSNDGSNILPLSNAGYLDFRPVIQLAAVVFQRKKLLPPGPWDEAAIWMSNGRVIPEMKNHDEEGRYYFSAPVGGWHMLRRKEMRLFLRAPIQFRHRPSQADILHTDVWWRGLPITHDAGTYSYNSRGPFSGMLMEAAVHNTVEVDGQNQIQRVGHFLFLPWPEADVSYQEASQTLQATHYAYRRLNVLHSRQVRPYGRSGWIVKDELRTADRKLHRYQIHWLLADWPFRFDREEKALILDTPLGSYAIRIYTNASIQECNLIRAEKGTNRGWWAPHYLEAKPALSFSVVVTSATDVQISTVFENLELDA